MKKQLQWPGKPRSVSDFDILYGTSDLGVLLPPASLVPARYADPANKWCVLIRKWFFDGLPRGTVFTTKAGIDQMTAIRHLRAVLCHSGVNFDQILAPCAWLAASWVTKVEVVSNPATSPTSA